MRFVLIASGRCRWPWPGWRAPGGSGGSLPGRLLVGILLAGARLRGEPGRGAGAARAGRGARPRDRPSTTSTGASRPTAWAGGSARTCRRRPGSSARTTAASTSRATTRWSWPTAAGPGSAGAANRPRRSSPGSGESGFTHVLLCPPVPETAVEFDPTLGRLLAPWLAGRTPLYREDLADADGVVRRYAIYRAGRRRPTDDDGRAGGDDADDRHPTLAELRAPGPEGPAPRDRQLAGAAGRAADGRLRDLAGRPARALGAPGHAARRWLADGGGRAGDRRPGRGAGSSLGVALAHLAFWLDHVDGQVARWRGTASLDGVYLDYLMHHAANLGLGFGLGYGLAARTGDPRWAAAGFAIALGWAGPEPAQRLPLQGVLPAAEARDAASTASTAAAAAVPPRPPPGRAAASAALTWPAFKACEPHVVLIGLTGLAAAGAGRSRVLAGPLARGRPAHGRPGAGPRLRPSGPGGDPRLGRVRVRPLVPALARETDPSTRGIDRV